MPIEWELNKAFGKDFISKFEGKDQFILIHPFQYKFTYELSRPMILMGSHLNGQSFKKLLCIVLIK